MEPVRNEGRVNGLPHPNRFRGRRVRIARAHPVSLVAGIGLYAVALVFPVFLRQVNPLIIATAVLGTALLILGLHVRWTRTQEATA